MADDCVCVEDADDRCGAFREGRRGGWYCTRKDGHDGDHVACSFSGQQHRIVEWNNDASPKAVV